MTTLEARVLRIEQTMKLAPVELTDDEKKLEQKLIKDGIPASTAHEIAVQEAIEQAFIMNMDHYPDQEFCK